MKFDALKRSRSRRPIYSARVTDEDGKDHYELSKVPTKTPPPMLSWSRWSSWSAGRPWCPPRAAPSDPVRQAQGRPVPRGAGAQREVAQSNRSHPGRARYRDLKRGRSRTGRTAAHELGPTAQTSLRHRRGTLPQLRRRLEDHRRPFRQAQGRHRRSAGHRHDPHFSLCNPAELMHPDLANAN